MCMDLSIVMKRTYLENCLLTSLLAPEERSPLKSVTLRTAASETRRVPGPRSVSATSPRPLSPHGTSEKSGEGAAGGGMLQCCSAAGGDAAATWQLSRLTPVYSPI